MFWTSPADYKCASTEQEKINLIYKVYIKPLEIKLLEISSTITILKKLRVSRLKPCS